VKADVRACIFGPPADAPDDQTCPFCDGTAAEHREVRADAEARAALAAAREEVVRAAVAEAKRHHLVYMTVDGIECHCQLCVKVAALAALEAK